MRGKSGAYPALHTPLLFRTPTTPSSYYLCCVRWTESSNKDCKTNVWACWKIWERKETVSKTTTATSTMQVRTIQCMWQAINFWVLCYFFCCWKWSESTTVLVCVFGIFFVISVFSRWADFPSGPKDNINNNCCDTNANNWLKRKSTNAHVQIALQARLKMKVAVTVRMPRLLCWQRSTQMRSLRMR